MRRGSILTSFRTPARVAPPLSDFGDVPAGQCRHSGVALPQPARHPLGAADDVVLVIVALGQHDAQDLEHRVPEVRVPAAGAEADLAEDLAVAKAQASERRRRRDEIVERAIVPLVHERVPGRLHGRRVARAHRRLQLVERGFRAQRLVPRGRHLAERERQVVDRAREPRGAGQVHDRRAGGRGQRVRERAALELQEVGVVREARRRARKAHAAELGHRAPGPVEALRAQPPADAAGLVDDRAQAELRELVRRDHAGHPGADDRDGRAQRGFRQRAEPGRVGDPVVVGVREVRAEDADFPFAGDALGHGRQDRVHGRASRAASRATAAPVSAGSSRRTSDSSGSSRSSGGGAALGSSPAKKRRRRFVRIGPGS